MRSAISELAGGRIAVITTRAIQGRDTIDARGLVVLPASSTCTRTDRTPETYRFYALDGVTTALELELARRMSRSGIASERRERINYGVSIGHIKVRMEVMHDSGTRMPVSDGAYRAASPAQIADIANASRSVSAKARSTSARGFPTRRRQRALSCSPCPRRRENKDSDPRAHSPGVSGSRKPLRSPPNPRSIACRPHQQCRSRRDARVLEMIGAALARRRNVTRRRIRMTPA